LEPLSAPARAEIALTLVSETGGGETGIDVRWSVRLASPDAAAREQSLAIGEGFLG
jgi:hypothetical protein